LNSNVDAAKSAIQRFDLPATTKAYGSPDALAADPDIDLVICNTRVDKHYETILPIVKAGKDVFVEWPIAANHEQVQELVEAAKKSGSRVAVGLQRRWAPPVEKVREIVRSGKLGKVLSSEAKFFGGTNDRAIVPSSLKYFLDREIGGNVITISFAHAFDYMLWVLGELDPATVHTTLQLQRPENKVKDPKSGEIIETVNPDVPDLVSLQGRIASNSYTVPSATLSLLFRRGQPFPGTPELAWSINFEKGEVLFTSENGLSLTMGSGAPVKIQVHYHESDKVEEVPWTSGGEEGLSETAKSVQKVLFQFADGEEEGVGWLGLEEAAKRAEQLWGFLEEWDKENAGEN